MDLNKIVHGKKTIWAEQIILNHWMEDGPLVGCSKAAGTSIDIEKNQQCICRIAEEIKKRLSQGNQ